MFPVLFWQQLFSVPCFKVTSPLRLIRCIAFSCVLTCYSPLVVLHVFIFSLTHCPLLHVSWHHIPWVFHHSYHFLPSLCFFFSIINTKPAFPGFLSLAFWSPFLLPRQSKHQPFPTVPQTPLQFVISQLYNVTGYMKEAAATQKIHVVINDSCGWSK